MNDEKFMERCLDLARLGAGKVSSNPMVGCVIVHKGKIVAEGYHEQYGGPHAEVNAIAALPAGIPVKDCSLYVNLEPCSHHGKTPPCCDLIIEKGFRDVVVGCRDSNPEVSGKGIARLKAAGLAVGEGILEARCRHLNRRFFTFHEENRPMVILKWAQSADGYIGSGGEERIIISGLVSQRLVHKWRSEEDAILIGARTAALDNPLLNTRFGFGKNPLRVIVDPHGTLDQGLRIFDKSQKTLILTSSKNKANDPAYLISPSIIPEPAWILEQLYKMNIQSVIVEGGNKTLIAFINSGLWDEARIFRSEKILGGGTAAPVISGRQVSSTKVGEDTLLILEKL